MRCAYYPGCSLHGTAREYDISTQAVCKEIGIELVEVPDWNCCGASSAHSIDQELSFLLPSRNIKIIEEQNLDVIIPCAACFCRTKACMAELKNNAARREKIEKEMNVRFTLKTNVYHLMELMAEKIGIEEIRKHSTHPLNGLRVVCYYGCLLVRPHDITQLDDEENPQFLDELMSAIGVTAIDWSYKTECCGAALSLSRPDTVRGLVETMIRAAEEADAQAIVTACPLCQANLEMRQGKGQKIAIFYFTELLGLAFGLKEIKSSLNKHLISTEAVLKGVGKT